MGPKKRNRGTHSKQSNATSSDHTKGDTKKPREEKSNQTEREYDIKRVIDPYEYEEQRFALVWLLRDITKSSHKRVCSYWKSLSIDLKKQILRIKVQDLKRKFKTEETDLDGYIQDVVSRIKPGEAWTFWICFSCSEWHSNPGSYLEHVGNKHIGNTPSEMEALFPQKANKEWIKEFNDCSWEPLDVSAAVDMLEKQAKSEEGSIPKAYCWPLSNDSERANLLKNIQGQLNMLIRHKYLADSQVSHVIKLAKDEILGLAHGSQILNHALNQSPCCICFLEVPKLWKIHIFLLELINACGLVISEDKNTNPQDDLHNSNQIPQIEDKFRLNDRASCILLDGSVLLAPSTTVSAAVEDMINTDPFLSWLFSDSCLQQWSFWNDQKVNCRNRQTKLVEDLKKVFEELQGHCKEKHELMNYDKALKIVDDLCLDEGKKRESLTESVQQSYESVLKVRHEDLSKSEEHVSNTFELNAITNVLEQAQAIKANQSGSEENPTSACDLESQMDSCIKTAIKELKETQSKELCMIDGRILRSMINMERLKNKLACGTAYDFRGPFLPLMKTYIKARLDDLAVKYASDSLLVTVKSEKGDKGESDGAEHTEKTITKNITEENRTTKTSDLKATHGAEKQVLDTNIADNSSVAPDKKKRLEQRLIEIQAEKKSIAEQEEQVAKERQQLYIEIEEKTVIMNEQDDSITQQQKELEDEEEKIRIELEKLDDKAQDPAE